MVDRVRERGTGEGEKKFFVFSGFEFLFQEFSHNVLNIDMPFVSVLFRVCGDSG